jgi:hypothetical protein
MNLLKNKTIQEHLTKAGTLTHHLRLELTKEFKNHNSAWFWEPLGTYEIDLKGMVFKNHDSVWFWEPLGTYEMDLKGMVFKNHDGLWFWEAH